MEKITENLRQYEFICKNIDVLNEERKALQNTVRSPNGHEHIGGKSSVRSASSPTELAVWRIMKLDEKLEEEEKRLHDLRITLEDWLRDVDPEISVIIRVHFFDRQTWKRTCEIIYGYPDKDYPRKKIRRYFEQCGD